MTLSLRWPFARLVGSLGLVLGCANPDAAPHGEELEEGRAEANCVPHPSTQPIEFGSPECQAFTETYCARESECSASTRTHYDCLRFNAAACQPLGLQGSSLDDARLLDCLEEVEGAHCAGLLPKFSSVGMRACTLPGSLAVGEPCEYLHQCASMSCLIPSGGAEPECRDTQSLPHWVQVLDVGDPADGQTCHNLNLHAIDGICQLGNGEGAGCPCNTLDGLWCVNEVCVHETNLPIADGQCAWGFRLPVRCPDEQVCWVNSMTSEGHCVLPVGEDQPCGTQGFEGLPPCAEGFTCVQNLCRPYCP